MDFAVPDKPARRGTSRVEGEEDFNLSNDELDPSADYSSDFDGDFTQDLFEQYINDAETLSRRGFDPDAKKRNEEQLAFVDERVSEWVKTTQSGRNFLHQLAYYERKRKSNVTLQWLMARAILRLPDLMGAKDRSQRTPLTVAFDTGNEVFVHVVCKNQKSSIYPRFQNALLSECEEHDNDRQVTCLHAALNCSSMPEKNKRDYIRVMCQFVPEEIFTVKDMRGRTPLHLAVEYKRCCETQVDIVRDLLRRGSKALGISISSVYSKRDLSVYQYFKVSQNQPEKKSQQIAFRKGGTAQDAARKVDGDDDIMVDLKKATSRADKNNIGPPRRPGRDGYKDRSATTSTSTILRDRNQIGTGSQNGDISASPIGVLRAQSPAPAGKLGVTPSETLLNAQRRAEEDRRKAFELIADELKLSYLRIQEPQDATRSLAVHDKIGKELWFDFGDTKTLRKDNFEKNFRHLQFDRVLQYVALPDIGIVEHGEDSTLGIQAPGRMDMVFTFEWLRKKGVKRIIKVIVDDLGPRPTSDEAIEEALKPFGVEVLDWRRIDLDPALLSRVGSCLREVHLQWSGNNTVLRAWSEPEGLAKIPTLEAIHITQVQSLESPKRIQENLREFEARLGGSWPENGSKPQIHRPRAADGRIRNLNLKAAIQPSQGAGRALDQHRWMKCMDDFASVFRQIQVIRRKDSITDPKLGPVNVALIDDGVDITHPDLKDKGILGTSFHYYRDKSTRRVSPYWNSAYGHGTLMARLILRVCPSAVIHAIKLQTFRVEGSTTAQIDPKSAIEAIKYATKLGVHIISMSWTTVPPPETADKYALDSAIGAALNEHNIRMFCAASDQGQSSDRTYPHASNGNSFRIGAARSTGGALETVGDLHKLDFLFPGHEVVLDDDGGPGEELARFRGFEAHTGSSVATALAAGLAALVIECVRLGVVYTNDPDDKTPKDPSVAIRIEDLDNVREKEQMRFALKSIGTDDNTHNRYIEVWQTFSRVASVLRDNLGESSSELETIAGLARVFLRKGVVA